MGKCETKNLVKAGLAWAVSEGSAWEGQDGTARGECSCTRLISLLPLGVFRLTARLRYRYRPDTGILHPPRPLIIELHQLELTSLLQQLPV